MPRAADPQRGPSSPFLLRAGPREGGLRAVHDRQPGLLPAGGPRDPVPRMRPQVR